MTNKTILQSLALWGAANFLASCSAGSYQISLAGTSAQAANQQPFVYGADITPPADAQGVGGAGTVNATEINILLNLQYPQTYESIRSRVGTPRFRDKFRDYYQIEGTARWIALVYSNDGSKAVQMEVGQ